MKNKNTKARKIILDQEGVEVFASNLKKSDKNLVLPKTNLPLKQEYH